MLHCRKCIDTSLGTFCFNAVMLLDGKKRQPCGRCGITPAGIRAAAWEGQPGGGPAIRAERGRAAAPTDAGGASIADGP